MFIWKVFRTQYSVASGSISFMPSVSVLKYNQFCSGSDSKNEASKKEWKPSKKKKKFFKSDILPKDKAEAEQRLRDLLSDIKVNKPLGSKETKNINIPKAQKQDKKIKQSAQFKKLNISPKLEKATVDVAGELGGNVEKTKNDLFQMLSKMTKGTSSLSSTLNLSSSSRQSKEANKMQKLLKGMDEIETIDSFQDWTSFADPIDEVSVRDGLGIFTCHALEEKNNVKLKLWDDLEKTELEIMIKQPPRNCYEKMIQWTEEGKLWHFPIDNDQGMDEEAQISFAEHVFLEDHLEPWCPKSGPIRQFMNLVLIGLSKNSYLKVEEKHEHIYWFRDYFESKKKIFTDMEVITPINQK